MGQTECIGKESLHPNLTKEGLPEKAASELRLEGPLCRPRIETPKGLKKAFHSPCGHLLSSSAALCLISYSVSPKEFLNCTNN